MANLNYDKFQEKAILSTKNTLLIAGAGCGKSTTIVGKINHLLSNDIKEKDILCLSFTNASVDDLKSKINNEFIEVKTFHKLAVDIIKSIDSNYSICSVELLNQIIDRYLNELFLIKKKKKVFLKYVEDKNTFIKICTRFINLYKCGGSDKSKLIIIFKSISKIKNKIIKLKNYYYMINIVNILKLYSNELNSSLQLDFDDLIIKATELLKNNNYKKYKYIIIDEFQDTSLIRLNLIKLIHKKSNATIFCVGDDYQSIYQFTGCDVSIFINFKKYFDNSSLMKLTYTYRNSQQLINVASNFIMKNKYQIKKSLISNKKDTNPIKIIYYKKNTLLKLLKTLNTSTLILGRNNNDIYSFLSKTEIEQYEINYMTIHRSKGLEADNVIIINLENTINGIPSKIKDIFIISKLLNNKDDVYFEERRLFYVALTRTRNKVYLFTKKNNESEFIKEIIKDNNKKIISTMKI